MLGSKINATFSSSGSACGGKAALATGAALASGAALATGAEPWTEVEVELI